MWLNAAVGRTQKYNIHCNNSSIICKACTHPICFLKDTMFLKSAGSGWFPNNTHNHNRGLPLSFLFFLIFFFLSWGFFWKVFVHNPQVFVIVDPFTTSVLWLVVSWCLLRHGRPEGVGGRLRSLLRGEPVTRIIGHPMMGTPFHGFPLVISGSLQVCSEFIISCY